jgi:hypothetical protein
LFERNIAIFASAIAIVGYYGFQIKNGYALTNHFPLVVALTSSPNCAHCDVLSLHFPFIEFAVLSALFYGALLIPGSFGEKETSSFFHEFVSTSFAFFRHVVFFPVE